MVKNVLPAKDERLRKKSKPVKTIDARVKKIITDLKDTLAVQKDPEGVGLAAPQIGKNVRIFIINYQKINRVVINPKIIETKTTKGKKGDILEGCLSLPNYYAAVDRPGQVKIKYTTEEGNSVTETFEDFFAAIILHELDHLEGKLFIDHALAQKSPLYRLKNGEWENAEL